MCGSGWGLFGATAWVWSGVRGRDRSKWLFCATAWGGRVGSWQSACSCSSLRYSPTVIASVEARNAKRSRFLRTPWQTRTTQPFAEHHRYNVRGRPRSVRLPAVGRGQVFGVPVRRARGVAERLDFVSLSRARPGMVAFWLHLLAKQRVEENLRTAPIGEARTGKRRALVPWVLCLPTWFFRLRPSHHAHLP